MADVTTIRHTGRPRPLGEVKDDSSYMQVAHRTPAKTTGLYNDKNNVQQVDQMRESLRTATLINIVAAVNGNSNGEQSQKHINDTSVTSSTEGLGNTMAVISNLVLTKDRSISIPRPQVFLEAPKKISVRKPVFYKNSQHEVNENKLDVRKRAVSLTRTRTTIEEEKDKGVKQERPKSENIQISVSLQQARDGGRTQGASKEWIDTPAKVRIARSMSPRRRLVSVNKKPDSRVSTAISKCDAVDIMDTTENLQGKPSTAEIQVNTTDNAVQEPKLYRARSLPALFPVKRKRDAPPENRVPSSVDKSKFIAPFKVPSVRAYGGMPNILCGKTLQAKNETFTDISLQYQKGPMDKPDNQDIEIKPEKGVISASEKDINMKLDGRSIPNPRSLTSTEIYQGSDKLLNKRATGSDTKLQIMQDKCVTHDHRNHSEEIYKIMTLKENKFQDTVSENSVDIANYGLVGRGYKSSLSSAKSRAERHQKGPRKVTFADKSEDEITVLTETRSLNSNVYEEKIRRLRFLPKRPVSPSRNAFSPLKAKSCGETSRTRRRILPGYDVQEKPRGNVMVNVKVSGLTSKNGPPPRPPSRLSDVRSMVSEASSFFDDLAHDWNGKDIDATDRTCTNEPLSYGTSSFYTEQNTINMNFNQHEEDSYDEDEDEETDVPNSYRIVKAIDLGTLSGFQHRKFKKPTLKREPTSTTHFIKIKMKG